MSTVAGRVARGAALLDDHVPGWPQRIDLASLEMAWCGTCVIGQAFDIVGKYDADAYADALKSMGLKAGDDDAAYGFDAPHGVTYARLAAEWRRVIAQRRARVPAGATT